MPSWLQDFHAYLGANIINLGLSNVFTSISVSFDYYSHEKRYLILENSCSIFHTVQEISLHLTQAMRESQILWEEKKIAFKVFQLHSLLAVLDAEEPSISACLQPELIPFPGKPMPLIRRRTA